MSREPNRPAEKWVFAPPHVRRLARERGVDLDTLDGSGPGGRLTEQDVPAAETEDGAESTIDGSHDETETRSITATPAEEETDRDRTLATAETRKLAADLGVDIDAVPASEWRDGDAFVTPEAVRSYAGAERQEADDKGETDGTEKRSAGKREIRRTISGTPDHSTAPRSYTAHHARVDAMGLVDTRERLQPLAADRDVRLTHLPIALKAVVGALEDHPILNATIDGDTGEVAASAEYDLGVAIATDHGLIVPVVEAVDEKTVLEVAAAVTDQIEQARDGSIGDDETRGGPFIVTDFGAVGEAYATLGPADSGTAALALGSLAQRPTVEGGSLSEPGEVVAKPVLPLSLSVDRRAVDGAKAARFLDTLEDYLRDPTPALLD
ncbi:MAG: 2-oxo acid dehydrogenase subunit E2 [Halapricum sp.]